MPTRRANARWEGGLRGGNGNMKFGGGAFDGQYSFTSRFEEGEGTNPEELLGAAYAGCFSMAFAGALEREGYDPQSVETEAQVTVERVDGGFKITRIQLDTRAQVPGIDESTFQQMAENAKNNCPVSQVLQGVEKSITAELVG